MMEAENIQQLFQRVEDAAQVFMAGDPAPILAMWSHAGDVTVFGGAGAYAQGWRAVEPRLAWAAQHFRGGHGALEPIAMGESGDLAYTVCIERGKTRSEGSEENRLVALRVTHIYRREDGAWKIIHRHADPIMERTEFASFKKE